MATKLSLDSRQSLAPHLKAARSGILVKDAYEVLFKKCSPHFLLFVCRSVCKSWKSLAEQTPARFPGEKSTFTLLQEGYARRYKYVLENLPLERQETDEPEKKTLKEEEMMLINQHGLDIGRFTDPRGYGLVAYSAGTSKVAWRIEFLSQVADEALASRPYLMGLHFVTPESFVTIFHTGVICYWQMQQGQPVFAQKKHKIPGYSEISFFDHFLIGFEQDGPCEFFVRIYDLSTNSGNKLSDLKPIQEIAGNKCFLTGNRLIISSCKGTIVEYQFDQSQGWKLAKQLDVSQDLPKNEPRLIIAHQKTSQFMFFDVSTKGGRGRDFIFVVDLKYGTRTKILNELPQNLPEAHPALRCRESSQGTEEIILCKSVCTTNHSDSRYNRLLSQKITLIHPPSVQHFKLEKLCQLSQDYSEIESIRHLGKQLELIFLQPSDIVADEKRLKKLKLVYNLDVSPPNILEKIGSKIKTFLPF